MQTIKYLELPPSFDPKLPMSVQLRNERLKLFPQTNKDKLLNLRKYADLDTPDFPLLQEACDFLDINFAVLNSKKATKYTGPNYDLFAIVYYLRSRNICTLDQLINVVFKGRNIQNYKRHIPKIEAQQKYINLFTYLDSLQ